MIEVVRTATVQASPGEVWSALAAYGEISAWAPNVDHSCLMSDQREGIGAVRRIQSGRYTIVERVTTWDPPSTLAYRIEGLPPVIRTVESEWRVEAAGAGAHLAVATRVDAGRRPPQRLIARVVTRRLAAASEAMLAGLADHLERQEARA